MKVYLDYNATTPVDETVFNKMKPYFSDIFANASAVHSSAQEARKGVDWSKDQLAQAFSSQYKEVVFTSGATESNNLAIRGLVLGFKQQNPKRAIHIVTTSIEHPSVYSTCKELELTGVEVTYVAPDSSGIISSEMVREAITDHTVLVSVMYVNNETGIIQPVREIGKMIEKINREREKADDSFDAFKKVYMHIDAVQGAYYLTLNAPHLHVDLLSISAHKLYGPKGVGALYVRTGTPLRCITSGGEQEYSLRPGTYNTPGIVGFGAAMELINNEAAHARDIDHIRSLRENFLKDLKEKIPSSIINGSADYCVPGTISMRIPGISGESLVLALDMKGIAVSTGSACSAGSISPSRTLCEMGLSMQAVRESVRISLGKYSTQEELSYVIDALAEYASKK